MPTSVLWVCLVAVWLFVLVPMILKGRPEMKKSTDAAKATRLLHRGGTRARRTSRRAAGSHPHDSSWKSERVSASRVTATAVLDDDAVDGEALDGDAVDDDDTALVDVETVDDDAAQDVSAADDAADDSGADDDDVLTGEIDEGDAEDAGPVTVTRVEIDVVEVEIEEIDYVEDEYDEDFEDEDEYDDEAEFDDEFEDEAEFEFEDEAEFEDEEPEPAQPAPSVAVKDQPEVKSDRKSRRRSAYTIDSQGDALRYKERQRVTLTLLVVLIAAIVSGVLLGRNGWIATGVASVLFVGYMFYLRRTVKAEQKIRAQRVARARRAARDEAQRQRREEQTPEFAAEPAPTRLRRPGGAVVLEIDDEDPVFDHLPPFQRRRVMREDPDFRHAEAG